MNKIHDSVWNSIRDSVGDIVKGINDEINNE